MALLFENAQPGWRERIKVLLLAEGAEFENDTQRHWLIKETHLHLLSNFSEYGEQFVKKVLPKRWKMLSNPAGILWITTDSPGFSIDFDEEDPIPSTFLEEIRIGTHIFFPLSKNLCLQICPYLPGDPVELNYDTDSLVYEACDPQFGKMINFWSLITQDHLVISADHLQITEIHQAMNT